MRFKFSALFLALSLPAYGGDVVDRTQIPTRVAMAGGQSRYVGALAVRMPLFQIVPVGGGGGGSSAIISGTTPITGGADTQLCFNDGGTLSCGDAGAVYNKTTDNLTVGAITTTGATVSTFAAQVVLNTDIFMTFQTGGSASTGWIRGSSIMTPDAFVIATGANSESVHIFQVGDVFDFNNGRCLTAACTNPSLIIHSPDQVTTEYLQLQTDATGAAHVQSNLAELTVGGFKNNFTEGSAQVIVRITMPSGGVFGAFVTYTVSDSDGTDHVGRNGSIQIQGANKAGTSVCTILATRDQETEDGSQIVNAAGAFTLTYTWTNVVNTTSCDLSLNSASSAGANTNDITYIVHLTGNSNAITVTPIP